MILSKLRKIFNHNSGDKVHEPVVREMTLIGKMDTINNIYIVQQSTLEGVKNYCICAHTEVYTKIIYELRRLNNKDIYSYLKNRLLIEPFIEDDLEKVLEICRLKLPKSNIREYSIFML